MKFKATIYIVLFISSFEAVIAFAFSDTLKIPFDNRKISIDGDLSDWGDKALFEFSDTLHSLKCIPEFIIEDLYPSYFNLNDVKPPLSRNRVEVKAMWNKEYLYLALKVYDKHLYAEISKDTETPMLHLNDAVEIYLDTKNEAGIRMDLNDYQFLLDVNGNSIVFRGNRTLIKDDTLSVPKEYGQNIFFKKAVKIFGTINQHADVDSFYVCEIGIPFYSIGIEPKSGDKLGLDICVDDIDYSHRNAQIVEYASTSMWSFDWIGYSDFGYPKYWKTVILSGTPSWYDSLTEKYKKWWAFIYFISLLFFLSALFTLFVRYNKLRQFPSINDVKDAIIKINIEALNVHDKLSYNQSILSKATEFVIHNKAETIHAEDIAKSVGLSIRTFQRITKDELNLSPSNLVCVIKLHLAEKYLVENKGNITEAAYEFGFANSSYFSKLFKKHYGKSPSAYIKEYKK